MVLICYNCELRTRCVLNFLFFFAMILGVGGVFIPLTKNRNYLIDPEENLVTLISLSRVYICVYEAISHKVYPSLYPPQTLFVGGYTVFTLSDRPTERTTVRVSVTFCFLNILKNH